MIEKRYLGDSVYAAVENGMIKLTTENGKPDDPSNTIFLELEVVVQLQNFINDTMATPEKELAQ